MTAPNTAPIVPGTVGGSTQTFQNADGTTSKVIYASGANGSRVDAVSITSTDTAQQQMKIIINDGAADHVVGWVTIPITAGTDGVTKSVSLLNSVNETWLSASGSIFLKSGWSLKLAMYSAVTVAKLIDTVSFCGDY